MSFESPTRRSIASTYLENLENLNQTKHTVLPPPTSPSRGLHSRTKSLFEANSPPQVPLSPSRSKSTLVPSSPSSRSLANQASTRPRSILDLPSSPTRLKLSEERLPALRPTPSIVTSLQTLSLPSLPGSPVKVHSSRTAQSGKAFEYLCRVSEAKEWITSIINEEIPTIGQLIKDGIKDGVVLAKLTKALKPQIKDKITVSKFQYHHTDNINIFFKLLDEVKMPNLFRFELNDLYEGRNIPKVIICIHALSAIVAVTSGLPTVIPSNGPFSDEDLQVANTCLRGLNFPNFESLNNQFKRELRGRDVVDFEAPKSSAALLNPPVLKHLDTPSQLSSQTKNLKSPFLDNDVRLSTPAPIPRPLPTPSVPSLIPPPQFKLHSPKPQQRPILDTQTELSKDDDFEEALIRDYNSSPTRSRSKKLSESEFLDNLIKLQACARGANARYAFFIKKKMLDIWSENIIDLQSIARRATVLRRLGNDSTTIETATPFIVSLQSIIRGNKQRNGLKVIRQDQSTGDIVKLQSIIRGNKVRESIDRINFELFRYESKLIKLQSRIRSNVVHDRVQKTILAHDHIVGFQCEARRVLFERKLKKSVNAVHSESDAVLLLQSIIRGDRTRKETKKKLNAVHNSTNDILELQSIIRGAIVRNKLNVILDTLEDEDRTLNKLVAIVKGKAVRKHVQRIKTGLGAATSDIVRVQATVRGVITRYSYEVLLDNFDIYAGDVAGLQSLIRGYLYRKSRREILQYYEQFLPSIIKIQSYIRGKYLGNAYKSLISMQNPPLSVVKKFSYLLIDNDVDFQEEVKLTQLKEHINEKTLQNERLEKHIDQLNLKIVLLEKNKIELDEVLHQMNKSVNSMATPGNFTTIDLSSLNYKSKNKIELYEKFFYLLQTQPSYLTKLINCNAAGVNIAFKIFSNLKGDGLPTREEYFFIKLLENVLKESILKSSSIDMLQKDRDSDWSLLLNAFTMDTQVYFHINAFSEIMETLIDDTDVDFESNPIVIYKKLRSHSLQTFGADNLTENQAISDPETEKQFIENLQQLRGYSSEIFNTLNQNINSIPAFIKILCRVAYQTSMKKYPQFLEQEHLSNAGFVFIRGFIGLMFKSNEFPKIFKFESLKLSKTNKTNLQAIGRLLTQLFLMKPFGARDPYFQPLNRHIISLTEDVTQFIKSLIEVGDIESVYQMTIYDDMTAHNRPKLTLNVLDMISIGEMITRDVDLIAPYKHDTLREILTSIKSLSTPDLAKLNGYYTLNLNPSIYKPNADEVRAKALNMQLKRCVLYLIQVEDESSNLYELLRSPVNHLHEFKFKQLIDDETREIVRHRVNDYTNDGQGFLGDLTKISYKTLKNIAFQRVNELESLGLISKSNGYQTVINEIASDIKNKNDQRLLRKRQLNVAENAIIRLEEKGVSLRDYLSAYGSMIDRSMEDKQSHKSPKKRMLPFTKQFFYERKLKRGGRIPQFGAFKYSFKKLYEKGILAIKDNDSINFTSSNFFTGLSFPRVDFMFVCNEPGVFEVSSKSYDAKVGLNGQLQRFTLDELLFDYQFEKKPYVPLFNGLVKFDTYCFINFIFKKFYHSEG